MIKIYYLAGLLESLNETTDENRGLIFVQSFPYEMVWPKCQWVKISVSATAKMKQSDLLQKNSKTEISILTLENWSVAET